MLILEVSFSDDRSEIATCWSKQPEQKKWRQGRTLDGRERVLWQSLHSRKARKRSEPLTRVSMSSFWRGVVAVVVSDPQKEGEESERKRDSRKPLPNEKAEGQRPSLKHQQREKEKMKRGA